MACLERMLKGEDIDTTVKSVWGPETEFGYPVELELKVSLSHNPRCPGYCCLARSQASSMLGLPERSGTNSVR